MDRNRLYTFIAFLTILSFAWLGFNMSTAMFKVCFFNHITSFPCPACGTTQSVLYLAEGNIHAAIMTNPLGLLVMLLLIITPIWLLLDLISRKSTLHSFYCTVEIWIKNKYIGVPLIILILINWTWNLMK